MSPCHDDSTTQLGWHLDDDQVAGDVETVFVIRLETEKGAFSGEMSSCHCVPTQREMPLILEDGLHDHLSATCALLLSDWSQTIR